MDRQTVIAALRDALAELYPEEQDTRVIVADAGVDAKEITFSGRARTNWHNILLEASRQSRLDVLLQVVHSTYGNNPTFQVAYGQYHQWTEQDSHRELPSSLAAHSDSFATITSEAWESADQRWQEKRQTRSDDPEPRNPVGQIQVEATRIHKPETTPPQRNQSTYTEQGRPQPAGTLRRIARNGVISLVLLLALIGIVVIYFVYQTIKNPQAMGSWLMGGAQVAPIPADRSCPQRFGAGWLQKPLEFYGAYVPKTSFTINQVMVPANNPLWVEWQGNNGKLVGIWVHVGGTEAALGPFNPQTTDSPSQWIRFADLPFYGCIDSQNRVLVAFEP